MAGLKPHEAAAQEAYEEAGVVGVISDRALGTYQAAKSGVDGSETPVAVTIFPMRVVRHVDPWPEKGQRSALWFETESAARVVAEPELAKIIENFQP
jgi:8-oxo-dGTP pyrophosphatase MutT (NUDIX family)